MSNATDHYDLELAYHVSSRKFLCVYTWPGSSSLTFVKSESQPFACKASGRQPHSVNEKLTIVSWSRFFSEYEAKHDLQSWSDLTGRQTRRPLLSRDSEAAFT